MVIGSSDERMLFVASLSITAKVSSTLTRTKYVPGGILAGISKEPPQDRVAPAASEAVSQNHQDTSPTSSRASSLDR